ncbi:MAG: TerB family tellurite resistance protein [Planctomycetota bacterium]|nr:TerB family tellurite resistance protein [Planctomycetota bacterium]
MSEATYDIKTAPESQRVGFFGSLFAIANADDSVDKEELQLIFETLDTDGLSESNRKRVMGFLLDPPTLRSCLTEVANGSDELRFALMTNLIDVALADNYLDPKEKRGLDEAQKSLKISDEQRAALRKFIEAVRELREKGEDDSVAVEGVKQAVAGLGAVGIPLTAVYFTGAVVGFSAAGITSGLAALGLGFGMVTGIGVAVALGAGAYYGLSYFMDTGNSRKKANAAADRERRAQLVIQNLQAAINEVIRRIDDLKKRGAQAAANEEAIRNLQQRLGRLMSVKAKKEATLT